MTSTHHLDPNEIADYLDRRSEWAILTTIDAEGYPHSVPLGYYRIDDVVYVGTPAHTNKVLNAEADSRASLLVTSSKTSGDWSGVLLQGDLDVVRDDAERLAIEREGRRQRGVHNNDLPEAPREGEVLLRLRPRRTISWSH